MQERRFRFQVSITESTHRALLALSSKEYRRPVDQGAWLLACVLNTIEASGFNGDEAAETMHRLGWQRIEDQPNEQ